MLDMDLLIMELSIKWQLLLVIVSFFCVAALRYVFIKRLVWIVIFHSMGVLLGVVLIIGGAGVISASYDSYEHFVLLEQNGQLEYAKAHLEDCHPMFQHDLLQFESSKEFRDYLQFHDKQYERQLAVYFGWFCAFLGEILLLCLRGVVWVVRKITTT